jgi:hypothetical protein
MFLTTAYTPTVLRALPLSPSKSVVSLVSLGKRIVESLSTALTGFKEYKMSNNFITPEMLGEMASIQSKLVEKLLYKESVNPIIQDNTKINLQSLPRDIHEKIAEHYKKSLPSKYVLRDWVSKEKLDWFVLSGNPCAINILMEKADYENSLTEEEYNMFEEKKKISWMRLCINEEGAEILKKYPSKILWSYLSNNSKQLAVDMIKERIEYEKINVRDDYYDENRVWVNSFSDNKNPEIMELVKERVEYEKRLSPEDYDMLEVADVLDWCYLTENPSAIDILKANPGKIIWSLLSNNTNPLAIDLLRERAILENNMSKKDYKKLGNKIDWASLTTNANAIELLKEYPHKIKWEYLSANTAAIDWLKENKNVIDWGMLSENPAAIQLLKENRKKIHWEKLCKNPNAIELLKKNRKKINWRLLCLNENAFELIKERAEYEMSLTPEEYNNINIWDKLDWKILSENKGIFVAV